MSPQVRRQTFKSNAAEKNHERAPPITRSQSHRANSTEAFKIVGRRRKVGGRQPFTYESFSAIFPSVMR